MGEEIVLNTRIDLQGSEKTIGEIKKEYSDLLKVVGATKEGTKEYRDALIKLGDAKAVMKDLKENIIALDPEKRIAAVAKIGSTIASGFAAGQAAVALFGNESEDMARIMVKVQAAMALAQGLQGLAGFAKSLEVARIAMIAFAASNPFTAIAAAVGLLATAIAAFVVSTDEGTKSLERLNKEAKEFEETSQRTEKFWERRLRLLKAQGATIEEVAINQRQAFKQELEDLDNQIKTAQKLIDAGDEEGYQKLTIAEDRKKEILLQSKIFELKVIDDIAEREGKAWDDREALRKRIADKEKKDHEERIAREKELKSEIEKVKDILRELSEVEEANKDNFIEVQNTKIGAAITASEKLRDQEAKNMDNEIRMAQQRIDLTQGTFDAIGSMAISFAGKSEASQKKAFEINKAAGIASALIQTYQAAQGAFMSQTTLPLPDAPIRAFVAAGLATAAGLARVAAIARTQFKSSTPEAATPSPGGGGSPPSIQSPQTFSNTTATQTQTNQQGDFQGFKREPIKVFVTETDMSATMNRVKIIEQKNSF